MNKEDKKRHTLYLNQRAVALIGIAALTWAICGLLLAAVVPAKNVPRVFANYHVEHFVAFYCVMFFSLMALPRASVRAQWASWVVVAAVLGLVRLAIPYHQRAEMENFLCDVAGATGATLPLILGRIQERSIG